MSKKNLQKSTTLLTENRLNIYLSKKLYDLIFKKAMAIQVKTGRKVSMNQVVRHALEDHFGIK